MGGDGGVLPTGRKFIRACGFGKSVEDKKEDGRNVTRAQVMRTTICAQSSKRLVDPIIACEMGNLYSKEAMLTAFIDKTLNPLYSHVRGMKDVKTLKLTPNPAYSIAGESEGESRPEYLCPVTDIEFNGKYPFVVIWSTGFVISEKAIREIGVDALQQEYGPFTSEDIVPLIPSEEELKSQRINMEKRRENMQNLKNEKKGDKKSKRSREAASTDLTETTSNFISDKREEGSTKIEKEVKKVKLNNNASLNFGTVGAAGSAVNLTSATALARKAAEAVESQETKSKIFKDLFHKGHEADKHGGDLFMRISGLRYNLN
jgi:hypothetical protein